MVVIEMSRLIERYEQGGLHLTVFGNKDGYLVSVRPLGTAPLGQYTEFSSADEMVLYLWKHRPTIWL